MVILITYGILSTTYEIDHSHHLWFINEVVHTTTYEFMTPRMRSFPYGVFPTTYQIVPARYEVVPNHLWGRSYYMWGLCLNCSIFAHHFQDFITRAVQHRTFINISRFHNIWILFVHLSTVLAFPFVDEIVCTIVDGIFAHMSILTRLSSI